MLVKEEEEMKEMVGGCCVCSDERGWDENPLVYCDGQGCNVAVHQACYGIVTVPSGPWFCRKCESQERAARVKCELCPSRDGALKRTDQSGWAHVVCALYIPEVRFGNVTTMEPILISLIPPDRFNKNCYICDDNNRGSKATAGACMQCNKPGCKANFHVTCAQMQGLLCEEAGNLDNVKYCGYCQYHNGKLKTTRNVKIIPPFRPVPSSSSVADSPGSSPDKAGGKSSASVGLNDEANKGLSSGTSQRNSTGVLNPSGDSSKSLSTPISPDISSSSKNSKNLKKGSIIYSSTSNKSAPDVSSGKLGSASIIPKIAQPILTAAAFSSTPVISKSVSSTEDKSESGNNPSSKSKGSVGVKQGESSESSSPVKCDDNLTIKLERVDDKNSPHKVSSYGKKDFTTLQLKEVVTAALDRPMSSSGSKFDLVSTALTGSIESPISTITSGSGTVATIHSSGRLSHGEKPAPPDIKPHVTLTPIPMRSSSARLNLSRDDDREERDKDGKTNKSPITPLNFHNTFGPPKLLSQQSSPDAADSSNSKGTKPSELNTHLHTDLVEKNGPPAKRPRGGSREEDRGRKTPTKGQRGRRGSSNASYSKRDSSNGAFIDESSHDDLVETSMSSSSNRGGRNGPGRKPGRPPILGRPAAEDPPAPTLSQLKSQMEASSDSTLSSLPPHMLGNALNPASSMAQRMVETLSQEMEVAVAAGGLPEISIAPAPNIGIPLPGKSTSSAANGQTVSSMVSSTGSAPPQTLEQLLERQWEQGSQFLMEQAQHLDIAQLLSCLNQLKQDNRALEEHVQSLVQRRDQLIAINARLSIPLGSSSALGPLGPGFSNATNGSVLNGHGTPPPTLQAQTLLHSSSGHGKSLQVSSSTASPQQQQHDFMMQQHGRMGSRETYQHSSEMTVSRPEIGAPRPSASPQQHNVMHASHNHRGQNISSFSSPYPGHPSSSSAHHSSSHHAPNHNMNRDSSR